MAIEQALKLDDDTVIYVDIDAEEIIGKSTPTGGGGELEEVSIGGKLAKGADAVRGVAEASFEKTTEAIGKIGGVLNGAIREAMADQAEVEIALKIKGGGDVKLVSAMAEYDMKVKLTWKYPRPPAPGS